MQEKTDELYQEYLEKKLNEIFVLKDQDLPNVPKIIERKGKLNYKTADKNPLCDEWFEGAYDFSEGFGLVVYPGGKYGYVDTEGKSLLGKVRFDYADKFQNGYARVGIANGKKTKYNYIDKTGKLISKKWYDSAFPFYEGRGIVIQNYKYGFIDTKGDIIGGWYNEASRYVDGIACVRVGDRFTYVDMNGNSLKKDFWFEEANAFKDGRALVKQTSVLYNFIDREGNFLSLDGYAYVHKPVEKYNLVMNAKSECGFIDKNCNIVGEWYYDVEAQGLSLYLIRKKIKNGNCIFNYFDTGTGKLLLDNWTSFIPEIDHADVNCVTFFYRKEVAFRNKSLEGYDVKKILIGYQCSKDNDKFTIKYEPVKIVGKKYVLCFSKSGKHSDYFLYDRENNSYKRLGNMYDVKFSKNFIHDYSNGSRKFYFTYNGEMLDITDYYRRHLTDNEIVEIKEGIEILSKDEFFIKKEDAIRQQYRDEEKQKQEEILKQEKEKENKKLESIKKQNEESEEERQAKLNNAVLELKESIKKLEQLEKEKNEIIRIPVRDVFVDVGTHKEINPIYLEIGLKHIDLKGVSFDGVKIAGIDFRGCNITFNPQRVFERDLRGCNFEGVLIPIFADFTGVDIRGAKFSKAANTNTMNVINAYFSEALYDETTTYDGVPLTELIEKEDDNQSKK